MNRNRKQYQVTPDMWDVDASSGCWVWQGAPNASGYCHVSLNGVRHKAHRAVYENLRGSIPTGLQLDHLCRNRVCVNPAHLEPVTQTVNIRRGLRAKLTIEKARQIRAESHEHWSTLTERYGVSKATIHKVLAGTAWRDAEVTA